MAYRPWFHPVTLRKEAVTPSGSRPLGFAIVGCGVIARFHARALADVPDTRVVAQVSRREANARALADDLGRRCDTYTDLAPVLTRRDVDVVIITTPSGAHLEPATAAAAAGKHVVVEKPLEVTLERCDQIIAACNRHQAKLCTIFPSRFGDANQALKAAVAAGRFGRLTLGETTRKWWRPQSYYDEGGWKGTRALDGGALMNQAIHNVDLLCWMMGPVTHINGFTATLAHERIEVEDTAVACLRFASGALESSGRPPASIRACPRPSLFTAITAPWSLSRTMCCGGTSRRPLRRTRPSRNALPRRRERPAAPAARRRSRTSGTPVNWPISSGPFGPGPSHSSMGAKDARRWR
jgi:hypothetical protein